MVHYIILSKLIKHNKEKELVSLLKKIVIDTSSFKKDYPNYENWFWEKQVSGLFEGNRDTIVAIKDNKIIGISNIKNTPLEKKICTLSVDKRYRMRSVGSKLVDISLNLLGTKTPVITMNLSKLPEFRSIINKNGWIITSYQKDLYKNGVYEIFFNDYQAESKEIDTKIFLKEMNYNIYKIYCYYLLKKYIRVDNRYHNFNINNKIIFKNI